LLARLIRFSKESACLEYIANPAEETTMPAIMNMAIVLSLSSPVDFVCPITAAVALPDSSPVTILNTCSSELRGYLVTGETIVTERFLKRDKVGGISMK